MKGWGKYGKWNTRKIRNIWRGIGKATSAVQVSSFLNTRGEQEAGLGTKCSISWESIDKKCDLFLTVKVMDPIGLDLC